MTVVWRKSSYSDPEGGNCVEVAAWRKSSYSNSEGGECVEVATWRKSSYSNNEGGMCVEIAPLAQTLTGVRDSKRLDVPHLSFPAARWADFLSSASSR